MATFNRFDDGSHITYQIVDAGNTLVNLTPDEAYELLEWLHQRDIMDNEIEGNNPYAIMISASLNSFSHLTAAFVSEPKIEHHRVYHSRDRFRCIERKQHE